MAESSFSSANKEGRDLAQIMKQQNMQLKEALERQMNRCQQLEDEVERYESIVEVFKAKERDWKAEKKKIEEVQDNSSKLKEEAEPRNSDLLNYTTSVFGESSFHEEPDKEEIEKHYSIDPWGDDDPSNNQTDKHSKDPADSNFFTNQNILAAGISFSKAGTSEKPGTQGSGISSGINPKELITLNKENTNLKAEMRRIKEKLEKLGKSNQTMLKECESKNRVIEALKEEKVKLCNLVAGVPPPNPTPTEDSHKIEKLQKDIQTLSTTNKTISSQLSAYESRLSDMMLLNEELKQELLNRQHQPLSPVPSQREAELTAKVLSLEGLTNELRSVVNNLVARAGSQQQEALIKLEAEQALSKRLTDRLKRAMEDLEFYRKVLRDKGLA